LVDNQNKTFIHNQNNTKMKATNNTVLITGGSAGIGFEIATFLSDQGNDVIITGRNKERLESAAAKLKGVTAILSDVSKEADVNELVANLKRDFPALNMVINNAGNAFVYDLATDTGAFEYAYEEMLTNYLSVVRLNELLLPQLRQQPKAAIVNVSSIVAFVPGSLATYSASKAALHSYTLSLRIALAETNISVFELMPPLVDTTFSAPIGGHTGISPKAVAEEFYAALQSNELEIHVGHTAQLYKLFLSSPAQALHYMTANRKQLQTTLS
jgi:uncharacterized oxidoreductase